MKESYIENLSYVDEVIDFEDDEKELYQCINKLKKYIQMMRLFFANGGDRNQENIPEMSVDGVKF